ncbi:hypothetical protein J1N35_001889 [Gossypium stocksii]|uniref:DUF4283 domain-containing protein n=1 Tax=Gossypium stocksii TaxID=47602 RepID=A0A9D3WKB8_9ROSI|nr:hypothetical protein J1N35_001889 [Gossypium stocksii]
MTIRTIIKLDININLAKRGRFVRLAVCVDLQKLLIANCGLYGHSSKGCIGMNEMTSKKVKGLSGLNAVNKGIQKCVEEEIFNPWILVERRHQGKARGNDNYQSVSLTANQRGSRFTILEKEDRLNQGDIRGQDENLVQEELNATFEEFNTTD